MYNQLRIILFRTLLLSALLFSSGMVLSACQSTASNSTTSSQSSTWAEQAEGVCSSIYDHRGRPQQSENIDVAMALAEQWHSNLATKTASALEAIPGTPSNGTTLIDDLRTYAALSLRMANVYAEGGIQYNKITALESQREPIKREVESLSVSLGAPSCGKVVNTPE